MEIPSYTQLAEEAGISRSYAHEIVKGTRNPARPLAIHIMRRTGWRHPIIATMTEDQLAMYEAVEPWKPRTPEQAAA